LFAGISVISSSILALIVLPHLGRSKKLNSDKKEYTIIKRMAQFPIHKNKWVVLSVIFITVVLYFFSKNVSFESDLEKNNYMPDKLQIARENVERISDLTRKTIYLVADGDNVEESFSNLIRQKEKLENLKQDGIITNHFDLSNIIVSKEEQQKRIERWKTFWTNERVNSLEAYIENSEKKYGFTPGIFKTFVDKTKKNDFDKLSVQNQLTAYGMLTNEYVMNSGGKQKFISLLKVDNQANAEKVYPIFAKEENVLVFDKQVIMTKFLHVLKSDFNKLISFSLLLVFLILLITYGRFELAILTMLPLGVSWIWTTGIMVLLGIQFNVFNIIICTLVFGLGIDYAVFIARGILQEYKTGINNLSTYKSSILISSITTLLGIGVLSFARHPALNSIALVSIIGIASMVFVTFVIQPLLFSIVLKKKGERRRTPVTWANFFLTYYLFIIFLVGSIVLQLIIPVFWLIPVSSKRKKMWYNSSIFAFNWFLKKSSFGLKQDYSELDTSFVKKPSIIIANHQSHIDLVVTMAISPKIIILTNNWVWNSPIFGRIVRFAGYVNITNGYDIAIEQLKQKVEDGYSILVFPEGTRSVNGKVRRFHKGAFLLAEKLGLDIQPLMIHGFSDALRKGEQLIRPSRLTVKNLRRYSIDELGGDLRTRTKTMQKIFREHYNEFTNNIETTGYYAPMVKKSYIYRGPVLEWYTRVKIALNKNYNSINSLVPAKGHVTDIGCGYGYLSYILSLTEKNRTVFGIDYDDEKIAVAQNNSLRDDRIDFTCADVTKYQLPESDTFILSDVLHYLKENERDKLLIQCVAKLKESGKIIINDGNTESKKHVMTRITELFSTKILL
ncbi:MAG: 1-acyl-sn-glycerol-3-phosphate acyltransferase, partial [Bacteroidales bacterium]|nr:1-acyl-sn-glycerol-3-phosphate acyltransferase [Bacteroidales bacterium]